MEWAGKRKIYYRAITVTTCINNTLCSQRNNLVNKMYKILLVIIFTLFLLSCNNSTEPNNSDSLKLIFSSDKSNGSAPLTVKFTGKIEGDTEGIIGRVPDYFFFSQIGMTVIPYSIPDTTQALNNTWSSEITYPTSGEFKAVLLYQGKKEGENFNLLSDTLFIKVN